MMTLATLAVLLICTAVVSATRSVSQSTLHRITQSDTVILTLPLNVTTDIHKMLHQHASLEQLGMEKGVCIFSTQLRNQEASCSKLIEITSLDVHNNPPPQHEVEIPIFQFTTVLGFPDMVALHLKFTFKQYGFTETSECAPHFRFFSNGELPSDDPNTFQNFRTAEGKGILELTMSQLQWQEWDPKMEVVLFYPHRTDQDMPCNTKLGEMKYQFDFLTHDIMIENAEAISNSFY